MSPFELEHDETANGGNFWALSQFRASAGDLVLRDHLAHALRNAVYTSPDIQNQIINVLGDYIEQKIFSKVQRAQFFTIIADEVTDCSNKEQLSLVLRFVDRESNQIRADLVTFVECDTGVTGRNLADKMLNFLNSQGVDLTKMRGQAYDGAGSTAGKTNGVAALISTISPGFISPLCFARFESCSCEVFG